MSNTNTSNNKQAPVNKKDIFFLKKYEDIFFLMKVQEIELLHLNYLQF